MNETFIIDSHDKIIEGRFYTGSLSARLPHEDGRPYHTFRTPTVLVTGNHLTFKNCVFENTAGRGSDVGQALALYLDGDDITLEDCTLRGHQDTLFLAPLPEKVREKDGFIGYGEFRSRTHRTFNFRNCLIEGGVDFIFGGATAFFEKCEFKSIEPGYVFAPSTPKDVERGFVATDCSFTCSDDIADGSCCIARPWREYGSVSLKNCRLGRHISHNLWCDWADAIKNGTARFSETGSAFA